MVATSTRPDTRTGLGPVIADLLGDDLPVGIDCYDGSQVGSRDASTRLVLRSPDALRYILTAPGELGFARAYVAGELDLEGDIFEALELRERLPDVRLRPAQWLALARLRRRLAPAPAAGAGRGGAAARPAAHTRARRRRDRAPLRRLERLLPARPRTVDDVLVRGVADSRPPRSKRRKPRSTTSSAASSGCGRACDCSTSDVDGAAW